MLTIAIALFTGAAMLALLSASRETYRHIDDLYVEAARAVSIGELKTIRRRVEDFIKTDCWHSGHADAARVVMDFIDHRMR